MTSDIHFKPRPSLKYFIVLSYNQKNLSSYTGPEQGLTLTQSFTITRDGMSNLRQLLQTFKAVDEQK